MISRDGNNKFHTREIFLIYGKILLGKNCLGQNHLGRFFCNKNRKMQVFAFFRFIWIFRNRKKFKKTFFRNLKILKKSFFSKFFRFDKSKKNQRMQKKCIFRFLSKNTATIFLSHMIEMSHFARSQCTMSTNVFFHYCFGF